MAEVGCAQGVVRARMLCTCNRSIGCVGGAKEKGEKGRLTIKSKKKLWGKDERKRLVWACLSTCSSNGKRENNRWVMPRKLHKLTKDDGTSDRLNIQAPISI